MRASPHPRERARLSALRALDILDTPREASFDGIVELAGALCEVPIAVITLVDEQRQWFKAEVGLGVCETPVNVSICSHVILQPSLTVIPDTLADPRTRDNPLCFGEPHLRFYAGAPLQTDDGLPLGTLCVLDYRPRELTSLQKQALLVLADQVMTQMQLRRELRLSEELRKEVDHRVKNSLGLVNALLTLQAKNSEDKALKSALDVARDRVAAIAAIHDQLQATGDGTRVDLSEFVSRLVTSLTPQTRDNLVLSENVPAVMLDARHAIHLGIMLNELVTNALRHGFPGGRGGTIAVTGSMSGDELSLSVEDNGMGPPQGFDPALSTGLGMRLTQSLVNEMGGTLAWSRTEEGITRFTFSAHPRPIR